MQRQSLIDYYEQLAREFGLCAVEWHRVNSDVRYSGAMQPPAAPRRERGSLDDQGGMVYYYARLAAHFAQLVLGNDDGV